LSETEVDTKRKRRDELRQANARLISLIRHLRSLTRAGLQDRVAMTTHRGSWDVVPGDEEVEIYYLIR
jgi:hypothetical protein